MNFRIAVTTLVAATALSAALGFPAAAESVKFGVIAPLTGPGAPWGLAAQKAGEIFASKVNAAGGFDVDGTKYDVEVIAYDDQYKSAEAVAAYNRLINQDDVKYILIASSAPTMALKQSIEDDEIIALTAAYTQAAIDENTRFMFRLYSTSHDFLPGYVAWLKDNVADRRMITLNPNDETGWSHSEATKAYYTEGGFEVLSGELYERTTRDFAPMLTKIIGESPDIIDIGTSSPGTAGLIVRQARDLGFKGRIVQTGGAGWATVVDVAGKEAVEGMVNILYADPDNAGYQELAAAYEASIGQEPNEIIAPFYDGFNLLLKAIQKAGDVEDTEKVAAAIPEVLPMDSLQGDEMIWGEPQRIRTYDYIGVIQDGRPVVQGKVR